MAYNKGFNPDRLPAHAEPEQAAAMLSQGHPAARPPRTSSARPDYNKPPPTVPNSRVDYRPEERYGGRPSSYEQRPPPGAFTSSNTYDGRSNTPRYDARQDTRHGVGSPPPANYGHGSPPQGYHGRPPIAAHARPPPTPAPPRDGNDREALWRLFGAVDKDRSGALTEAELRTALVNGDWSPFDPHTVRMMIRMFDTDRSGSVSFDEFCGLWGFLSAWRGLFDRFDADHSGSISFGEFNEALVAFGYRLSNQFVSLLYRTYDRSGQNAMSFDLFVQACISLKRMTDVFKKYDEDRDGYITLSFEEFLTGAQALFLFNSISSTTDTGLY
ncbi:peflin [Dothidotthia symphoricarpi CBS 119687]|uniref:Peflin n=1 Tax=Dothidotthia symphoricarpi CBS 119687 TaxID=1392245 RepID=A0A6A6AM18_9PLEO|nr:peflin [Dothidotthia symphoricarpi CBS 119687]KAF2132840.1 peflin [Dothidotthia symphoricarpi CBS 119687]